MGGGSGGVGGHAVACAGGTKRWPGRPPTARAGHEYEVLTPSVWGFFNEALRITLQDNALHYVTIHRGLFGGHV